MSLFLLQLLFKFVLPQVLFTLLLLLLLSVITAAFTAFTAFTILPCLLVCHCLCSESSGVGPGFCQTVTAVTADITTAVPGDVTADVTAPVTALATGEGIIEKSNSKSLVSKEQETLHKKSLSGPCLTLLWFYWALTNYETMDVKQSV